MRVDAKWLSYGWEYALKQIYDVLSNRLTFEHNVSQITIEITSPVTPGDTFVVSHNLGRIPLRWLANPTEEVTVWEADRASWTDSEITLRCSGSSTPMTLTVW